MVKGNAYLYKNRDLSFALITKTPFVFRLFAFVEDTDSI